MMVARSSSIFVLVAATGLLLFPSVLSWSTAPLFISKSTGFRRATTTPTTSCDYYARPQLALEMTPGYLPRQFSYREKRRNSLVRSVQARAVDIDDRKSITDENSDGIEETFEPSLETAAMDYEIKEMTEKILNALFLAVSFGWAAYTILTIDSGMTRGWTQSEIAMRIPLDNWSNYETSLVEKPVFTKTLINVVIYLLGDWLSQTVFQKKNVLDFDVSRTLKNGFIGLCFGPLVHQYYQFSDQILPVEGGIMNRVEKILMDQTIYLTVKCSIYICAVGLLAGDDFETCKQSVKDKILGIVVTAWKFWPLVHCITYTIIPARHRILWVNSVDLIWNAILATKARKIEPEDVKSEAATAADIKESAAALLVTSGSEDALLAAVAVPVELSSVKKTLDDLSSKKVDVASPPIVQDVVLSGSHIEIAEDGGDPVLVAAGDEEIKVRILSSNATDDCRVIT